MDFKNSLALTAPSICSQLAEVLGKPWQQANPRYVSCELSDPKVPSLPQAELKPMTRALSVSQLVDGHFCCGSLACDHCQEKWHPVFNKEGESSVGFCRKNISKLEAFLFLPVCDGVILDMGPRPK